MADASINWNGNGVAVNGLGVLIGGESGSGKSDLTLRLLDRGALLIGDDLVRLKARSSGLLALPPWYHAGKMEIRNLGIVDVDEPVAAPVALVVELATDAPRFIEQADTLTLLGHDLPMVRLEPHGASLPLKVEWALRKYGKSAR